MIIDQIMILMEGSLKFATKSTRDIAYSRCVGLICSIIFSIDITNSSELSRVIRSDILLYDAHASRNGQISVNSGEIVSNNDIDSFFSFDCKMLNIPLNDEVKTSALHDQMD